MINYDFKKKIRQDKSPSSISKMNGNYQKEKEIQRLVWQYMEKINIKSIKRKMKNESICNKKERIDSSCQDGNKIQEAI
jgi:hypothetical protein